MNRSLLHCSWGPRLRDRRSAVFNLRQAFPEKDKQDQKHSVSEDASAEHRLNAQEDRQTDRRTERRTTDGQTAGACLGAQYVTCAQTKPTDADGTETERQSA